MFRTNKKINLLFNSEIFLPGQSYLEYTLLRVGIASRYSEYILMVRKESEKMKLINLMWN